MSIKPPQHLHISDKIGSLFATPLIGYQWTNTGTLNRDLEKLVLQRESVDDSVAKANAGGWQSDHDLLAWGEPCTNELKHMIDSLLLSMLKETAVNPEELANVRFRLDCWANVNREGDYNVVHHHPNALWSGVYYVSKGEPADEDSAAGKIEFLDPREAATFIQSHRSTLDQRCIINNTPGLMLMFPSWVKHMVHPHKGTGARVSIAFNALPVA